MLPETRPTPTGSPADMTIGIVLVALCAARLAGGCQARKSLRTPSGKTVLEAMTLSLDITQIPQPTPQSLERWPGLIRKNANFPQAARRLRAERQRPSGRRTAEQCDELAPFHSITSSASASMVVELLAKGPIATSL